MGRYGLRTGERMRRHGPIGKGDADQRRSVTCRAGQVGAGRDQTGHADIDAVQRPPGIRTDRRPIAAREQIGLRAGIILRRIMPETDRRQRQREQGRDKAACDHRGKGGDPRKHIPSSTCIGAKVQPVFCRGAGTAVLASGDSGEVPLWGGIADWSPEWTVKLEIF